MANEFVVKNGAITPNLQLTGSTSGSITVLATANAGTNTLTLPAVTGTAVTTGDTGSVTNTMLAGSIVNAKLTNSSITVNGSSISLGGSATITASNPNALTIGTGLSGTSYNGSTGVTIAIDSTVATLTGIQTLTNKTLTSPAVTTSLTTGSTTFNLLNTTATTINIGGASTAISIGNTAHTGTTSIQHDLYVYGNITFGGGSTQLSATELVINDPLIYIGDNNVADITDLGIVGAYNNGTHLHTGLVRDASDSVWKLFSGMTGEPTGSTLDFTGVTYAPLQVGSLTSTIATGTSPLTVTSTTLVSNLNSDYLDGQHGSYYTTAGNLTGTISSTVLGNSTHYIGTTAVTLNRASANLALTGISSVTLPGSTSGTVQLVPTAAVGTGTVLTIPAVTGTIVTTGDTGTVTNTMLAGSIAITKLASSTISGVSLGSNLNALTINAPLSGTSYNGSSAISIGLSAAYGDTTNPYASKTANYFLAAPNGAAGVPTFRAVVAADIPTLNQNTTGTASNITAYTINQNVGTANTVQHSDITTARAAALTTGYVYYGNTGTKYAGFDGTNFVTSMPMSFNILGSSTSCTGNAATVTNGVYTTTAQTLTNKSLSDSTTFFIDETDATKKLQFQLSSITTATTRTLTVPDVSGTIVTTGDTGTVTSTMIADGTIVNGDISASAAIAITKLASSTISGISLGSNLNALTISSPLVGTSYNGSTAVTLSIPAATASVNGYMTSTYASKLDGIASSAIALSSAITGYAAGANTALAATDTILAAFGKLQGQVTARYSVGGALGTPSSGTLTNCTFPTLNQSTTGNAATATTATYHSSPDGDRLSSTKLPTTSARLVRFDFVGGAQVGSPGSNYAGLMTYAPWDGTTASTGDASYQLAFASSGTNGTGVPVLKIRKGIDSTWNAWYDIVTSASGTATTATNVAGGVAGSVHYQTATATTAMTAASTAAGQVLTTVTAGGAPTWVSPVAAGSSGLFNPNMSASVGYLVTTSSAAAFTAPATAGLRYIVHSIHVTNIGTVAANLTSNITGTTYSGGIDLSCTLPIPIGGAVELLKKPKVMQPSDILNMISSVTSTLHATIAYEIASSTTYFGVGVNVTTDATYTDLYTMTGNSVLESIFLVNDSIDSDAKVTLVWTDGANTILGYFAYNFIVALNSTVELLEKPKYMASGYKLRVQSNVGNRIEAIVAGKTL
jgi:hypothetical protein